MRRGRVSDGGVVMMRTNGPDPAPGIGAFRFGPEDRLVPGPEERAVLAEIATLLATGRSLRAVFHELAGRGIFAGNGRPFAPSTLWPLVRNRSVTNRAPTS